MRVCVTVRFKMIFALFCVLLIGHQVQAVVNKGTSQVTKEEEKFKTKANDRISNSFDSPSDTYGPPLGTSFKGPAPVYGPPELVGDHGPTPIYPPPPPESPPPLYLGPLATSYGPPKQNFGLTAPLFPKPTYGPPKFNYFGQPKQYFTSSPASFALFRPPKPHYGPPLKLIGTPSQQYQPVKSGHGPPIPLSLATYGPPPPAPPQLPIQYNPLPNNEYGPPPPPPVPGAQPQYGPPQYGPPPNDIFGPPPPAPPPGVPAPPTPPDIKYDGWQPIAGLPVPNQSPPSDAYGPPIDGKNNHIEGSSSSGSQLSHASLAVSPHVPSDSYGAPIYNPEDQNLKTSVHESSASSESNGLPPPPLPQHEPLHNQGSDVAVGTTGNSDHQSGRQQLSSQYGTPSESDTAEKLHDQNLLKNVISSLDDNGDSVSNAGDSHNFPLNDLSLQQLPLQKPLKDYNEPPPTVNFDGKSVSDASLFPNSFNNFVSPSLPSYPHFFNGPYPAVQGGRNPLFPPFGPLGNSFFKQGPHYHPRFPGPLRPPPIPFGSLTPPQNREPIKFREPIPTRLVANIHKYLPPAKQQLPSPHTPVSFRQTSGARNSFPNSFASAGAAFNSAIAAPHVQYGTPLSFTAFNAQTPHLTYGAPNFVPPTSLVSTSSEFGGSLYSGVGNTLTTTYGTPVMRFPVGNGNDCDSLQPLLSANAPPLTGSLPHSNGELHSGGELHLSGGLSPGSEVPSSGELGGLSAHEGAQHSGDKLQLDFTTTGIGVGNAENPSPVFANSPTGSFANSPTGNFASSTDSDLLSLPLVKPLDNFLGGPPVNTLDLQHNEQQTTNLKDSYGNPVGLIYDSSNEASNSKTVHTSTADVSNELPSGLSYGGYSAEALTASLTAQGFGKGQGLESNEVDHGNQFLKTGEGNEVLSLAQRLTSDGADGFEIQGSKGIYKLQIQPANGELNTENSDGSIRHDQVLSDGLLQDILAAIEQPENGAVELQGLPQAQKLEKVFGPADLQETGAVNGHFITVDGQAQNSNHVRERIEKAGDKSEDGKYLQSLPSVALFFDTKYATKEIRSVAKSKKESTRGDQQIDSKADSA